jgi:hypothetical protein
MEGASGILVFGIWVFQILNDINSCLWAFALCVRSFGLPWKPARSLAVEGLEARSPQLAAFLHVFPTAPADSQVFFLFSSQLLAISGNGVV